MISHPGHDDMSGSARTSSTFAINGDSRNECIILLYRGGGQKEKTAVNFFMALSHYYAFIQKLYAANSVHKGNYQMANRL